MKRLAVLAFVASAASASLPDPAFKCQAAPPSWQMRCEVTAFPWGATPLPVFEVYTTAGENTDIDSGLLVYLSKGRLPVGFAVVMKVWFHGRLVVTTHWYDADRRFVR